jgi:hypothetical protein
VTIQHEMQKAKEEIKYWEERLHFLRDHRDDFLSIDECRAGLKKVRAALRRLEQTNEAR